MPYERCVLSNTVLRTNLGWVLFVPGMFHFKMACTVMSTLPLYTRISTFSMIYNIRATSAALYDSDQYCRTLFRATGNLTMSSTISDHFRCFMMFLWNSDVCSLISDLSYIDGLSMHPHTIVTYPMCSRTFSDFVSILLSLEISIIRMFRLYSFGWLYHYYSFRLWS